MKNNAYAILTEGKHWPEDYAKTATNLIKASKLGQQSWYTDDFIETDVKTFVDEFTPLSHKSSNLGFFMAIIRWFIEYSDGDRRKYQEFIERKLDGIIAGLLKIRNDKSYDAMAEQIKKMNYEQFMKLVDEVNAKTSTRDVNVQFTTKFKVIPIYSYEELNGKYGGDKTGWHGESEWCHTNGVSTYDSWTKEGTQMFFVVEREDWKDIKAPAKKPKNCYDEYGMSLIAILIDVKTNKLLNSTSRWNHVVLPASGAADTMFESWDQLNKAIGIDVEKFCREECKKLKEKLDKISENANEEAVRILKNAKIITDATLTSNVRKYATKIVVPNSVKSIGTEAFWSCTSLTSIEIPDSVESIGYWAFSDCKSLTSIEIPDSIESIGDGAFSYCTSLTSISIPNSVKSIGNRAFFNCNSLKSIKIPNSVKNIGYRAFLFCTSLTSLIFKDKTIDEVKVMDNYPWGIEDESVIRCEDNINAKEKSKMKKKYTKKQIEESISHWAGFLLENEIASEDEVKDLLGEGWMRRIAHSIKNAAKKSKDATSKLIHMPKNAWDKVFKPNKGVEMTLDAMKRIEKDGKVALKNVNIFASVAGQVYPIVGFALLKHKTVLVLLLDNDNRSAKPKTLGDLRQFFIDAKVNIKAAVDSIRIAEAPASLSESILLEVNAVDRLIDKNGWTKEQALEPDNLKLLKRALKQNEKKTIEKIEKHFAAASQPASKFENPTPASDRSSAESNASISDDQDSDADTEFEFPTLDDASDASSTDKAASKKPLKDAIKVLDNELIKVVPDKKTGDKNIGFVFTKSKAEIAIDKKEADILS